MGNLTENFSKREFVVSKEYPDLAEKIPISKIDEFKFHLFAQTILEPIRERLNCSIRISSGKRSKILNMVIKGVPTSEHRFRHLEAAIDFHLISPNKNLLWEAYHIIRKEMRHSFGQLIIYLDENTIPVFIHVSLPTNKHRSQCLVKTPEGYKEYEEPKPSTTPA